MSAGVACIVGASNRQRAHDTAAKKVKAAANASAAALKHVKELHRQYETLWCLAIAFLILAGAAIVLTSIHWSTANKPSFGLWRMIIGTDNRVSTSAVTATMWTFLVAFMLAYFIPRTWLFQHEPHLFEGLTPGGTDSSATIWDDYLLLLGGPFASLVLARGIVSAKITDGKLQKTVADDGTQSIRQALTDDGGNVDLVDSQYVIFNLVAFAYVIFGVAGTNRLPTIPGLLLALTGSSAATYEVSKGLQSSMPVISSVLPTRLRAGDRFTVNGTNLRSSGDSAAPQVSIGGVAALVDATASTGTSVVATVSLGTPEGVQSISLVSVNSTATSNVEVLSDSPVVLSVGVVKTGSVRTLRVVGNGFTDGFATSHTVTVQITRTDGTSESFDAPPHPISGPTQTVEGSISATAKGATSVEVISSRGTASPAKQITLPT